MSVVPWVIWLPLAGATLTVLLGRRLAPAIGVATAATTFLVAVGVARLVWIDGPQRHRIGGWGAPLGIDLVVDGLGAVMLLMTAGVGLVVSIYAVSYFAPPPGAIWSQRDAYWPLWLFLWASLNILFLSGDIFNVYIGLELLGLAAVALVILAGEPVALTAGMRYFLAALLGSLSYLFGVAILYAGHGTLDMRLLSEQLEPGHVASAAAVLMTVGLLLKTALFPLHFWLPAAHASAPAPVSAVLSGLVIKASFYLVLRLWFDVYADVVTRVASQLLGLLGAAAIVWGSIQAIRQTRLKLLIAYSTVAQIGYLFLLVPLATSAAVTSFDATSRSGDAWGGGIYQTVSHAFAKASLFMAAGIVAHARGGDDRLRGMAGIALRLPMTTLSLGLAVLTLIGLPPSGGFVGKWLLLNASIATGQWWWAAVILAGGLLAAGYAFTMLGLAFRQVSGAPFLHPVPRVMEVTTMAAALVAIAIGLRGTELLELLRAGG